MTAYRAQLVDSAAEALARFASPSFPFRRTAIFERRDAKGLASQARRSARAGPTAKLTHSDANSETYEVSSPRPGWLVVASMWSPGWHAVVNGRSTMLRRADFNLRAVAVPAGRSVVKLSYGPPGFLAGASISSATVLAVPLILLGLAARRRRRRSAPG